MKSFAFAFLLFFFAMQVGIAQQSWAHTDAIATFQQALDLYEKKQYAAAKQLFAKVADYSQQKNLQENATYYQLSASLQLNESNAAVEMEEFIRNHPTSNKRNPAVFEIGNYYFDTGNYNLAQRWLNQVDVYNLDKNWQAEYNFKFGYASLKNEDYKRANSYFNRVKNHPTYGSQAKYYLGYIAYAENDYRKAQQWFDEAEADPSFNQDMTYFKSDMSFKEGDFEAAIAAAEEKMKKANVQEQSQLNKIIGESYFNLQHYEKAIPYLEAYRGDRGKWSNTDHYQLGYTYFMQKEYVKAASEFNKIIGGKDKVAQNAYYHLAQSYLKNGAKSEALNAFKNVSELDFDPQIQQDAYLNYAKLSYEIGNAYTSVAEVLQAFIAKYPNANEADEIQALLVDAYLSEKEYEKALEYLEKSRDYEDEKTYQRVAYLYAAELFKENKYTEAKTYFQKAITQPIDKSIAAKAQFWNAEVDYLVGNYKEAILGFKQFEANAGARNTTEYNDFAYHLGYAYFKEKDYTQAQSYFEKYSKSSKEKSFQHDAYVRLGDVHFALGNYWPAMEAYNLAIAMPAMPHDYAFFQKAISYGFVDRNERKIEALQSFLKTYQNSPYRDDALYELGNTFSAENNTTKALTAYQQLIDQHPNSPLLPRALSKKGLLYYNTNQNQQALTTLKQLVASHPKSEQAVQAINTVRLIYIDQGQTEVYAAWIRSIDFVEIGDADIDNATFEAAENPFLAGDNKKAIEGFKKYLKQYPDGLHTLKANFYLAQLLYNQGDKKESQPYYEAVIGASNSEFTETALSRSAQIYLENEKYSQAIPLLQQLENKAQFTQNIVFAVTNLMKAYYQTNNYAETIAYADKVIALQSAEVQATEDAYLYSARAHMAMGNNNLAEQSYAVVLQNATGSIAAEALYYKAYFQHIKGNFAASTETVKELTKEYARFQEFGFKGLLVMAKNFYALDDAFNATYILESLQTSASSYPEIVNEAKVELTKMKQEISQKNNSVKVND